MMDFFASIWDLIMTNYKTFFLKCFYIILIVISAVVIEKMLNAITERMIRKRIKKNLFVYNEKKYKTYLTLVRSIIKYVVLFFAAVAVLSVLGLTQTVYSIIATAGVGGIAVGLGANSLINDTISGIFILVDDQFGVGDLVKIGDYTGTVDSLTIRNTRIRLADNAIYTIPNGQIKTTVNYSRNNYRQGIVFDLEVDEDEAAAEKLIIDAINEYLEKNDFKIDEPSSLGVFKVTPVSKTIRVEYSINPKNRFKAEREINAELLKLFRKNNIRLYAPNEVKISNQ